MEEDGEETGTRVEGVLVALIMMRMRRTTVMVKAGTMMSKMTIMRDTKKMILMPFTRGL